MVKASHRLFWLPAVPVVAAVVASALFFAQHGFGGGHGRYDVALGILSLPGILLVEYLPLPENISDFVLVILVPAVFNIVLWIGLAFILRRLLLGTSTI